MKKVRKARQIHRALRHAIEHIEAGNKELAINLLRKEIAKDLRRQRKHDVERTN